ncbi:endosomal protein P24B [Monosporozyma unispora]|nr:p24 complex component [Kazachstania unispora]
MKCSLTQVVLSIFLFTITNAHNVLLPPYGRRCFFEELNKGDELAISYQFGDRNPEHNTQLTGDFIVLGPERNEILKTQRDMSHGEISMNVPYKGKYQYCFVNENSGINTKDVTFNIHGVVYIDPNDSSANTLDGAVRSLNNLIHSVKAEQGYIVIRERTHRNTAESTNDRVKWWSVFQVIVVIANSLFQIYYLKRFFEVTSFV